MEDETSSVSIPFRENAWDQLVFRARITLDRIVAQLRLNDQKRAKVKKAFNNFITVPKAQFAIPETSDWCR
jgi:hypothetical protein